MKYLVLECHPSYAVVLDEQGRFVKVANLNYEVGQELRAVVPMREQERRASGVNRYIAAVAAAAACLCLLLVGGAQLFRPVGTVQMRINPAVEMAVNRYQYVVSLDALNADGDALIDGVSSFGKTVDALSGELADRAAEMGFLTEEGTVSFRVDGEDGAWKTAVEELLIASIRVHVPEGARVVIDTDDGDDGGAQGATSTEDETIVIPVYRPDDGDDGADDDMDDDMDDDGGFVVPRDNGGGIPGGGNDDDNDGIPDGDDDDDDNDGIPDDDDDDDDNDGIPDGDDDDDDNGGILDDDDDDEDDDGNG